MEAVWIRLVVVWLRATTMVVMVGVGRRAMGKRNGCSCSSIVDIFTWMVVVMLVVEVMIVN